jgi:hypothetical protein
VPTATLSKPSRVIPVSHRDGLYIEDHTGSGKSGERFAKIFGEVWKRFPVGDRENLQDGWQRSCPEKREFERAHSESHVPLIQLIPKWKDFGGFPGSTEDVNRTFQFGKVTPPGYLLRFFAPLINLMPTSIATAAIAHELFVAAIYMCEITVDDEDDEGPCHCDELYHDLLTGAGFGSIHEVNQWLTGVGINTEGQFGLRSKTTK